MEFLDPRNDVAFKKIFGSEQHKEVTISFLNSILEYTDEKAIKEIQFLNTEQAPFIIKEKKSNVLDIMCTDQQGNRYIVEMQVNRVKEFAKRMVYYGAKSYAMQLGKRQSYRALAPVIVVAILDFVMFPDKKNHKSIQLILDNKTYEQDIKELAFAFVELPKFIKKEEDLESVEDKWLYFIKQISSKHEIPASLAEGEFEEACSMAERMRWSEDELNAYDDAIVRATDAQGALELAEEKGMARGMQRGMQQGMQQGEWEKACVIAKKMLARNVNIEIIAEDTGLTFEQIVALKEKI